MSRSMDELLSLEQLAIYKQKIETYKGTCNACKLIPLASEKSFTGHQNVLLEKIHQLVKFF